MGFNPADYQPVEDRLRQFWTDHPDGRIMTDLVESSEGRYIIRATIYRSAEDIDLPSATGYAQEHEAQRGVNQTSALENCETSAIGRALANLGYAPKGKRPSREEMNKASRSNSTPSGRSASGDGGTSTNDAVPASTSEGNPGLDAPSDGGQAGASNVQGKVTEDAPAAAVDTSEDAYQLLNRALKLHGPSVSKLLDYVITTYPDWNIGREHGISDLTDTQLAVLAGE